MLAQAVATQGLFVMICHAFLTGIDAARLAALDAVMQAALSDSRVSVCTVGELAARVRSGRACSGEAR